MDSSATLPSPYVKSPTRVITMRNVLPAMSVLTLSALDRLSDATSTPIVPPVKCAPITSVSLDLRQPALSTATADRDIIVSRMRVSLVCHVEPTTTVPPDNTATVKIYVSSTITPVLPMQIVPRGIIATAAVTAQ
jgi:hypothetical protein